MIAVFSIQIKVESIK